MKTKLWIPALAALTVGCAPSDNAANNAPATNSAAVNNSAAGAVNNAPATGAEKRATATLEPRSGSTMTGTATFVEQNGQVTLTVNVENATPGTHGIHLHEKGDCSAPDAASAGAHWNPTNEPHGKMAETPQAHSGDMGNLEVGPDGKGTLTFTTDRWSIGGDAAKDVVGKSIVVHAKADDLKTQPSGDSGDRIGCGVIAG